MKPAKLESAQPKRGSATIRKSMPQAKPSFLINKFASVNASVAENHARRQSENKTTELPALKIKKGSRNKIKKASLALDSIMGSSVKDNSPSRISKHIGNILHTQKHKRNKL